MAATRAPPPMPAPMPAFAAVERPVFDAVEVVALLLGWLADSLVDVAVADTATAAPFVDADGLASPLMSTACVGCGPYVVSCVTSEGVSKRNGERMFYERSIMLDFG